MSAITQGWAAMLAWRRLPRETRRAVESAARRGEAYPEPSTMDIAYEWQAASVKWQWRVVAFTVVLTIPFA